MKCGNKFNLPEHRSKGKDRGKKWIQKIGEPIAILVTYVSSHATPV